MSKPTTSSTQAVSFGLRLKELRKRAGLTQTELGAAIGVSNRVICYYERETQHPPTRLLPQLAKILGVSADELLGIEPLRQDGRTADAKFLRRWQNLPESQKKSIAQLVDSITEEA